MACVLLQFCWTTDVVRLQVGAQWTVAQQINTDSVLQVDCLISGEQEGSLQLTAKACPTLPRLVRAMDSMQAHSTAVAVAALTCGVDAAKAVLRKSEHLLPPSNVPTDCLWQLAAHRMVHAATRPRRQALRLCTAHAACASL